MGRKDRSRGGSARNAGGAHSAAAGWGKDHITQEHPGRREIVPEAQQLIMLTDHIALTPAQGLSIRGWELPATLSREQWRECGQALARMDEARQWWLGDWWNAGVAW